MSAITLDSIQPFFDYLKFEKRYSVHTLTSYETDLKDFIDFLSINYPGLTAKEITHTYIRSWLADLKGRGLESSSINRKISSLRSLYKFFLKMGVVDHSPMNKVNNLKTGRKLPMFVKEQEAAELMQTLRFHIEDWRSLNAYMLITIFYSTGMRLSELVNLKEKQLDLDRKQIKVLGKGNKERIIPVSGEMVAMLRDYIQQKREEFAGNPGINTADAVLLVTEKGKKLYPKYAWNIVNAQLGQATSLEKKSPHVLRHSFATHLMNNGADLNAVKELLGHSSLAATQVYTHNTIEKLRDIHKKAHPKG